MSRVLYYSNQCPHCKNILIKLSRSEIKSDVHFLCIDKRFEIDGKIYLILENGDKILLPKNIVKVPALMLLNKNNVVLFGKEIDDHFNVILKNTQEIQVSRNTEMEPQSFSMGDAQGFVKSDIFSFIDSTPEELGAKGTGGTRLMYNYAALDANETINTPPEDYKPNKVDEEEIKKYRDDREKI